MIRGARPLAALAAVSCAAAADPAARPIPPEEAGAARMDPLVFRKSMARRLIANGAYDAAYTHLREALREAPDDAEAHLLVGIVYRDQGLHEEAEAALRRSVGQDRERAETHAALGVLYDRMGRAQQAERAHREALRIEPEEAAWHNNLGFSLMARGRNQEAAAAFREALKRSPGTPRYLNNYGFALARLARSDEARATFERAGGPAKARNNLGLVAHEQGRLEDAASLYREALSYDPDLGPARRNLERVLADIGRQETAAPPTTGRAPGKEAP